jgi:hypothetical protein
VSEFLYQSGHRALRPHIAIQPRGKRPIPEHVKIETRAKMLFIDNLVAQVYHVPCSELCAPTRCSARTAFARQVAMYLAHVVCGGKLTHIGKHYGRDRTTVAYACRIVEDRRDERSVDMSLDFLEGALRSWVQAQSQLQSKDEAA